MQKKLRGGMVGIAAMFLMAASSNASVVSYFGNDLNNGAADWRTSTTVKSADADGDSVYGTDGWTMWLGTGYTTGAENARTSSLPAYIDASSFLEGSGCNAYRGTTYADVDNPESDPLAKFDSGTITVTPGVGNYTDLASFTVTSAGSFVFGVMADNLDYPKYNSDAFTLTSSLGSSYEIALDATSGYDSIPDMYFFRVSNAAVGETFTLSGKGGSIESKGYATVAAVTWDTEATSTISFYGNDLNNGAADWRTATTAKPADVDGDNIYGTDGWVTWMGMASSSNTSTPNNYRVTDLPDYVSSFSESSGVGAAHWTYADIDDPTNPTVDFVSHTLTVHPGEGVYADVFSFTVDSDCTFTLGVMADNLNGGSYVPTTYLLSSSSGDSYEISPDPTSGFDQTPDMYFFQVEATAGDVFTLGGTGGVNGYVTLAAITWDSAAVPEPSTLALLIVGLGVLIFRRFK